MYSLGLQVLRAKVRGFHVTGSLITQRISRSKLDKKHNLWNAKRAIGNHARHHMIAYGFLRGISYERIEKCAINNQPNPQVVLDIMLAHADWQQKKGLNLEKVISLLTVSNVPAEVVAASEPSLLVTKVPSTETQQPHEKRL